jgi:hypothetical protein
LAISAIFFVIECIQFSYLKKSYLGALNLIEFMSFFLVLVYFVLRLADPRTMLPSYKAYLPEDDEPSEADLTLK